MEPQLFLISSSRISSHSSSFSIVFRPVFGPWPPRYPSSDHHVFIYSRQNFNFSFHFEVRHPRCVGSITKNFLCITHTVEHNYISSSSTVGVQLHVSALYVGHLQVVI